MPSRGDHLSERDREALRLAGALREQMQDWMSRRGVTATLIITPFVAPSGQPSVLIRMDVRLALAMILSLRELRSQSSPPRRDNGTYGAPPP
jgi:hypothetical protein